MKKVFLLWMVSMVAVWPAQAQTDDIEYTIWFSEDASYSAVLPTGWVADSGPVRIANSEAALAGMENSAFPPESGMVGITLSAQTYEDFLVLLPELSEEASLTDIANGLFEIGVGSSAFNVVYDEAVEEEVDGKTYAIAVGSSSLGDLLLTVYPLAPGYLGLAVVGFATGERDTYLTETFTIINSVRYSPPLEGVYEADPLAFNYPADWEVLNEGDLVVIGSSADVLMAETLAPDQFMLFVSPYSATTWPGTTLEEAVSEVPLHIPEFMGENAEPADPIILEVLEREVVFFPVPVTEIGSGGVVVTTDPNGDLVIVAYFAGENTAYQMNLLTVNVALSINNLADDSE